MFSRKSLARYGLLVDVGSGSIGFSIVVSEPTQAAPTVIWSVREQLRVTSLENLTDNAKALISVLTDMALTIQTEGLTTLQTNYGSAARITELQVTVAAPWSYTISRLVTYEQPKSFTVTDDLIDELATTASVAAMEQFQEQHPKEATLVTETSHAALGVSANGYRLPAINKQKTDNIALSHSTTLVYTPLVEALQEVQEKLFDDVPLNITSSIVSLYYTTRTLRPHVYDLCLVHITAEATEIGIVRDGSLTYCTHTAFGRNALVRELQTATDRPYAEVVSRLDQILPDHQTLAEPIIATYTEKLKTILSETGDALAIPRAVYLMGTKMDQLVFKKPLQQAATKASKTSTIVTSVDDLVPQPSDVKPTSINARFFHTQPKRLHFQYV